jgi:type VI secretion system secreted protein VgrG
MAFKASMKELAGPVSVPTISIASKVNELAIKRDLHIEYVDADGDPLVSEPVDLDFHAGDTMKVVLDENGKAILKNVPLGPLIANQPKRKGSY